MLNQRIAVDNKKNINKILSWTGLGVLGIFCYLYSMFWSYFAELNIQFPFLDFPIFVGEILLGACLLLLIAKFIMGGGATFTVFSFWIGAFF